ncbi:Hypothetical predicted protein, partial [Paramuricea clavata]
MMGFSVNGVGAAGDLTTSTFTNDGIFTLIQSGGPGTSTLSLNSLPSLTPSHTKTLALKDLTKILISSKIDGGGSAVALALTGAAGGTLVKDLSGGFVIDKNGHLKGDTSTPNTGLSIDEKAVINGNIENHGKIDGGVVIGTANSAFPLRSPTANASVTTFTNTGTVTSGFAIAGKQQVKGTPANSNGVDTFKLINKSGGVIEGTVTGGFDIKGILITASDANTAAKGAHGVDTFKLINKSGGVIEDDIALVAQSTIKFNLENDAGGKISGGAITVTKIDNKGVIDAPAKTIKANKITNANGGKITAKFAEDTNNISEITNHGIICLPVGTGGTADIMKVSHYKGESGSELHLNFSGALGTTSVSANLVDVGSATFKSGSKIVLCNEGATAATGGDTDTSHTHVLVKGPLTIEATDTLLYTKKFTTKTSDCIIEATDTGITSNEIKSYLHVRTIDDNIKHFFPNDPILVSDIATKFKNAHTINKAVTEASKTTVGGVALKTTDKKGVFDNQDKIADLMNDAAEHSKDNGHLFIDM